MYNAIHTYQYTFLPLQQMYNAIHTCQYTFLPLQQIYNAIHTCQYTFLPPQQMYNILASPSKKHRTINLKYSIIISFIYFNSVSLI